MLFPFLVILPGLLAIALPTPHTVETVTKNADGSIIHNIQVVSPQVEQGRGLVPAKINPVTGQPMLTASGQPLLDYDMATPNMLLHYFPTGILGLGLTALLASFRRHGGQRDRIQHRVHVRPLPVLHSQGRQRPPLRRGPMGDGGRDPAVDRDGLRGHQPTTSWTAAAGVLIRERAVVRAFLLGMFWKRATGHGAFAGLISGTLTALLHHGLTLPIEAHPGIHGGWITVVHHYPSDMAQNFWGAIFAFSVNFLVTVVVSLATKPKPESELVGLVHSLTPKPPQHHLAWWQKPETLGIAILIGAIALNIFFA
jgi:SSS family solute:Na+ symporter